MDKSRILDFVYFRIGRIFSRFQLAALNTHDLPLALATNIDVLLQHMQDKEECRIFTLDVEGELKRAAIFTVIVEERLNLERFGDVVCLDGAVMCNRLGWTIYPVARVHDKKTLLSGGLLFTAYEREDMFEWLLDALNETIRPILREMFTDAGSALCQLSRNPPRQFATTSPIEFAFFMRAGMSGMV
jgi:hypothetical protein